jgi:hypothetical protein
MEFQEIPLESLLLDTLNPRHDPVESQREALGALLDDKGAPQLLRLVEDIAEFGPSPIELAMVVPDGNLYIVVEGNRRVAAMKILKNPGLAEGSKIRRQIRDLSRRSTAPEHMACMVAASRDDARRWIELRHNGNQQGAGIVGWSPEMQVRFTQNFSGQRGRALRLTDALQEAYENDAELLALIQKVLAAKVTTLGRLVSDPDFRKAAGIEISQAEVQTYYAPSLTRAFWYRLLTDLDTDLTVSALKNKEQRAEYLKSLATVAPPPGARRPGRPLAAEPEPEPSPTTDTTGAPSGSTSSNDDVPARAEGGTGEGTSNDGTSGTPPNQRPGKTQRPRRLKLFDGLTLRYASHKAKDVLREAQRLDLTQFPNAAAVLLRVLVELVVQDAALHYRFTGNDYLNDRIRNCLHKLDPSGKADMYAAVRRAVDRPDSPFSVRTMHAYVHNSFIHPDAASVRAMSDNYTPFLRDLDIVLGSAATS